MKKYSTNYFIICTALFIVFFDNASFFKHVLEVYPFQGVDAIFVISLGINYILFLILFFALLTWKHTTKFVLVVMLIISAVENYFMQTYNVLIDVTMIENTMQTDLSEVRDLLNVKLFLYILFLGLLPSYIIYKTPINYLSWKYELYAKLKLIIGSVLVMFLIMFSFSKYYSSFFREQKILRFYTNPAHGLFSAGQYLSRQMKAKNIPLVQIGKDAQLLPSKKRKIMIMVVGEAARYDHFSLNGYKRKTNPLLEKEKVVNFSQMFSCGTTTAVSVPCIFSVYNRVNYSTQKGLHTENILDVLSYAGVEIYWRDNNSNSKGVADRVHYVNYKNNQHNTICEDGECRDIGMLVGLDTLIEKNNKDILIILHQMGNHGPAYYKRYPKNFEKFLPVCKTNQLESCSKEEIVNAYDNALLYTDYFLRETINVLKKYENKADTIMFYMADHGESLGDGGLYLHGIPYFIAPEHQKHVGSFVWLGKNSSLDKIRLLKNADKKYSQDNVFSSLLGFFSVKTEVYNQDMDLFHN